MSALVLVTGNTYPVKDQLRALGGQWDAQARGWRVPADKAEQAQALVGGKPAQAAPVNAPRGASLPDDATHVAYERWEPCKRVHLPVVTGRARYYATAVQARTKGAPAGAPGVYIVLSQSARFESAEDNEDMGDMQGAGWHVTLTLRVATLEEALPTMEARAAKAAAKAKVDQRAANVRELKRLCQAGLCASDDAARMPDGQQLVLDPGQHGGRTVAVLSPDGGGVAVHCGGYYDDYRPTLQATRDPRAVELFALLVQS